MSNSLSTIEGLVKDASLMISDKFVLGNLVNRSLEDDVSSPGRGGKVTVSVPEALTGELWDGSGSISTEDLSQTERDLEVLDTAAVSVELTGNQMKYVMAGETQKIVEQVIRPAVSGVVKQAESLIARRTIGGFARNFVGTANNELSAFSDIIAADKEYFTNSKTDDMKYAVLTPSSFAGMANLNEFKSMDFGENRPANLRRGIISPAVNSEFYRSPYLGTFGAGDTGGTLKVKGSGQSGSELVVDGFTNATGTVYEGFKFTLGGVTYTTISNATISSNEATLTLDKDLDSTPADNADVTEVNYKENVVFNPLGIAAAFLPGAYGENVTSFSFNGFGISIITGDTSTSDLSNTWTFAMDVAARVVQPDYGLVVNGA